MLQYIGARYVPIFYQNSLDPTSSEWESNVTYEPMVWVSLPNGHMYISKKEVPANIGTPASNPNYWLEAGQYNAYIQSLQDQIDDMNDGTVSGSLQNQINDMNDGTVSGSLQNQINDVNSRMPRRTAIFLGNSYAAGIGSETNRGIYTRVARMFDSFKLFATGGAGFLTYTNHSTTFEDLLDQAIADTDINNDEVTDIIILGAWGDNSALQNRGRITYESDMNAALRSFMTKVRANFTNYKLRVVYAYCETRSITTIYGTDEGDSYIASPFETHVELKKLLPKESIEYIGWIGWNTMMDGTCTSSDNYHPNDKGYDIIAGCFRTAFNGSFEYCEKQQSVPCGAAIFGTGCKIYITIVWHPDYCIIKPYLFNSLAINTPTQYSTQTMFTLDDASSPTNLCGVLTFGRACPLGFVTCHLLDSDLDMMATIKVTADGRGYIEGQVLTAPVTMTARANNSLSLKEYRIDHASNM